MTLRERQQQLGARLFEREGVSLPRDYGDLRGEHDALDAGAGLIDLAQFGVLRAEGPDRVAWLHKLVTVNVQALKDGEKVHGLLLTSKGHVAADFELLRLSDALLLYTSWSAKEKLLANLRRAIFREKVALTDLSDVYSVLSLQGVEATAILAQTLGTFFTVGDTQFVSAKFFDSEVLIVSSSRTEQGGSDLLVERRHAAMLWDMLMAKGACPIGFDALNVARIEANIPWYGDDFDETMLAPEARLDAFIAENKGCYTGQEVIARIKNRGHVNRLLVSFRIDGDVVPQRGDLVFAGNQEVGWVTSAVMSFARNAPLAFGYLRREVAEDGARVQIARDKARLDALTSTIELPASNL